MITWDDITFVYGLSQKGFTKDQESDVSLNGMVYDFSVDHSSIKIEDILNIHEYLMVKKHMKQCLGLLKKYL